MSRLTDRIETHGAMALLSGARDALAEISPPDEPAAFESLERLRHVLERLSNLIADAEPTLVSPELLQKLVGPLSALRSNADQYVASGNAAYLTSAEGNLDALIAEVGWPLAYSFKKPIGLRQYAATYHDGLDSFLGSARQQVDQLTAAVASLQAEVGEAVAALTAGAQAATERVERRASDAENHITAAVAGADQQLTTLGASVEAHKVRLDNLTETYEAQFASEQKTRQAEGATALAEEVAKHNAARAEAMTAYQAALAEEAAKHNAARAKAQAAVEAAMAKWSADAEATLEHLGEVRASANRLLGAIGERALAGGFGKYADDQKRAADRLRLVVFGVGGATFVVSAWIAWNALNAPFEWAMVLKAVLAIPLLFVAVYAAQQSSHHRAREREARRSELELAALDPYLANLPADKREQIKMSLAEKMFARGNPEQQADGIDLTQVVEVVKAIKSP